MQSFNPNAAFIKNAQAASITSNVLRAPWKRGRLKIQKLETYGPKHKHSRPPGLAISRRQGNFMVREGMEHLKLQGD